MLFTENLVLLLIIFSLLQVSLRKEVIKKTLSRILLFIGKFHYTQTFVAQEN